MMVLVGAGVAVVVAAVALGATVWTRRHRDRRDLEGHFQHEWQDQPRWASLADADQEQPKAVGRDQ
jgi:hypothetical protein